MDPFASPRIIAALFATFDRPWCIAGGWAIDLFLDRVTRPHADVDVAVFREDQGPLRRHLTGWEFLKVAPGRPGEFEPWYETEKLDWPLHELRACRQTGEPREFEILLNERIGDRWS
jgi:hypothetical protein